LSVVIGNNTGASQVLKLDPQLIRTNDI